MRYIHTWTFGISLAALLGPTTPAFAHHEAIFGPQSAAVLSAPQFVSAQIFTPETGSKALALRRPSVSFRYAAGSARPEQEAREL